MVVSQPEADNLVRDIINGVKIGRSAATESVESANWPSANKLGHKVSEIIRQDLANGKLYGPFSVSPFPHHIISPLGAFLKRDGHSIRLIHDLSFPRGASVNSDIDPEQFSLQYASVDCAVKACRRYSAPVLSKIDIKDAYKAIGIAPADWHLMGFKWALGGESPCYYYSKVLSFGLRSAPALFNQFAHCLELFMAQEGVEDSITRYVDDFLLVTGSYPSACSQLETMIQVARNAGFTIQEAKVTRPCKCLEFLGIIIDVEAWQLRISEQRMAEVRGLLDDWRGAKVMSKRRVLKLVGKLAFAARVVRTGRAFLGRLIGLAKSATSLNHRVRISAAARRDLLWWQDCLASHNGTCMMEPDWSDGEVTHIFTDASNYGFGAVCGDEWIAVAYIGEAAFPATLSINWRELHAAVKSIATWGPSLRGSKVLFHIDNTTTCHVLNKLYSPVPELMELIRTWCTLVEKFKVVVAVVYIATGDNVMADALSRGDHATFATAHGGKPRQVWPEPILYFDRHV